jgi:hypothetical protein
MNGENRNTIPVGRGLIFLYLGIVAVLLGIITLYFVDYGLPYLGNRKKGMKLDVIQKVFSAELIGEAVKEDGGTLYHDLKIKLKFKDPENLRLFKKNITLWVINLLESEINDVKEKFKWGHIYLKEGSYRPRPARLGGVKYPLTRRVDKNGNLILFLRNKDFIVPYKFTGTSDIKKTS